LEKLDSSFRWHDDQSVVARMKRSAIRGTDHHESWIVAGKSCINDQESCDGAGKNGNDAELDLHRRPGFLHRTRKYLQR